MRVVVASAVSSWRRSASASTSSSTFSFTARRATASCFSTKAETSNHPHKNDASTLIYQPLDPMEHPGSFVAGVTKEMLSESPDMQAFFRANFGAPLTEEQLAAKEAAHAQKLQTQMASSANKTKKARKKSGLGRPDPEIEMVEISDADWAKIQAGELRDADALFGYTDDDVLRDGEQEGYVAEPAEPYYKSMTSLDEEADSSALPKAGSKGRAARIREPTYPRNIRPLKAYVRHVDGTSACNRLRNDNLIPGMLSGGTTKKNSSYSRNFTPTMIMTPHNEIHRERDKFYNYFCSHVYHLTVWESPEAEEAAFHNLDKDAEITEATPGVAFQMNVLPVDYQKHPFMEKHTCLNYLEYHAKRVVELPIKYVNEEESPALKRGAFVVPGKRFVPCLIEEHVDIPDFLLLDCKGLRVKNTLRLDRIIFPPGIQYSKKHIKDPAKFLAGSVFGKASGGGDDDDEDGEGADKAA